MVAGRCICDLEAVSDPSVFNVAVSLGLKIACAFADRSVRRHAKISELNIEV